MKPKFQYFLNQHSNIYLEKDEHQALRTRKHYIQIFFLDDSIGIFMSYPCFKSGQLQRPTYRQYGKRISQALESRFLVPKNEAQCAKFHLIGPFSGDMGNLISNILYFIKK